MFNCSLPVHFLTAHTHSHTHRHYMHSLTFISLFLSRSLSSFSLSHTHSPCSLSLQLFLYFSFAISAVFPLSCSPYCTLSSCVLVKPQAQRGRGEMCRELTCGRGSVEIIVPKMWLILSKINKKSLLRRKRALWLQVCVVGLCLCKVRDTLVFMKDTAEQERCSPLNINNQLQMTSTLVDTTMLPFTQRVWLFGREKR